MESATFDVVIAGAGPAGAMCALSCARNGLKTALLETKSEADYGNPYVLELEKDVFDICDLPHPEGDEVPFVIEKIKAFSPSGWLAFELDEHPMHEVVLERLVRRLVGYAVDAGVEVFFSHRAQHPLMDGNKVIGVSVGTAGSKRKIFYSKIVIDATGNPAGITRRLPSSCDVDFTNRSTDNILAEARLYEIDPKKAKAAADNNDFDPETMTSVIGANGSFSTLSYMISLKSNVAFFLAGIKEENTPPTPSQALDELASRYNFVGKLIHRGASPIRIRRAGLKLVCDGFASIGESAGMVIPMHASGVTSSLLAGHNLGNHLAKVFSEKGEADTRALWPWCAEYQRGRGAVLASYDANRRMLQNLQPEKEMEPLFKDNIVMPEDIFQAFACAPLRVTMKTLPKRLAGIAKNPLLAAKLSPGMARIALVEHHWKKCPQTWNEGAFSSWKKTAQVLLP